MEDIPEGLNENHSFIHIGIFMSGSLNSGGFMHLICMQLFRQKKEPKTNVILEICSVGRRSNLLFSQKWCGWNRSLEAILDVPETGEVSTWNHSLLQRNTKPKLHTSQHLILIFMCEKICHCFWSLRRESVGCFWCWGGIQKSLLMVRSDVEIENENLPFLYKLVGTWAFSPHPKYDQINKIDNFKERLFPHDMVLFSKKYFEEKKDWRSSSYLFQDSGVPFSPGSDPSTRTRLTRKYFIRFDPAPFLDLHTKWCLEQCNTWYLVRDAHLGKHT